LAAIRALMGTWWGDAAGIAQHARQALVVLPIQDPWYGPAAIALGDAYDLQGDLAAAYRARLDAAEACKAAGDRVFFLIAQLKLAVTLRALGRLQETIALCRQQIQYAEDSGLGQTTLVGSLWAQWGEVLAELNDLDGALERAEKGVELSKGGDLALLGFSYLCLVRVLWARGELTGANEILDKLDALARDHDLPPYVAGSTAAWRAVLWLVQGEVEAASRWARERGLDDDIESTLGSPEEYLLLTRIYLAQGALEQASRLLQRLLGAAEASGRTPRVIEILALQALVFQAQGEEPLAFAALERALALAAPEGYVRIFVGEGTPMAGLLYRALGRGIRPDDCRRLLAEFPDAEAEPAAPSEMPSSREALIEPLSERELEILHLVADGLTNPEIAARLYLSLNTIKVHTRNIYGKLGVHNRTQAVARARAVGVLSSP
jgi:LuxR family maltose regulon positive regulatory protein